MKRSLILVLGVAAASGLASAALGDTYTAYSNTAESITGNIAMDDFGITFENGEALTFSSLVGDSFVVDGQRVGASVYSVSNPSDPQLKNGNQLCGNGDVTYVASWGAGDGLSAVAVFTGEDAPTSSDSMCASYVYQD